MDRAKVKKLERLQRDSLGYLLIRCGQLWNERGLAELNREAGGPVLREAHTRLVPHLTDPAGVRITALADRLGVSKQAVHQLVSELAEQEVVKVEVDPDDARARRVTLTDAGLEAMLHGTGVLRRLELELAPRLGQRETRVLKEALQRLLDVLTASVPSPGEP